VSPFEAMNDPKYERTLCARVKGLLTLFAHAPPMSLLQAEIFNVAEKRLAWTSERQAVLARNIANLSTPGFQAMDTPNFQQVLTGTLGVQPVRTDPNHLAGTLDSGMSARPVAEITAKTADKNGVRLEEQLMKVADTETLHSTVTAIFKKYMAMFNIALGKAS
jgi:flagellar basal-body rod protein FlgB